MTTTQSAVATQVYRVYIKTSPEAIWEAITNPDWTDRYGYGGRSEMELRPGGSSAPCRARACGQPGRPRSPSTAR